MITEHRVWFSCDGCGAAAAKAFFILPGDRDHAVETARGLAVSAGFKLGVGAGVADRCSYCSATPASPPVATSKEPP